MDELWPLAAERFQSIDDAQPAVAEVDWKRLEQELESVAGRCRSRVASLLAIRQLA